LHARREDRVEIPRALVLDLDAVLIFEWLDHREEGRLLITTPGGEHADGAAQASLDRAWARPTGRDQETEDENCGDGPRER
jgi:hypothetical protein